MEWDEEHCGGRGIQNGKTGNPEGNRNALRSELKGRRGVGGLWEAVDSGGEYGV